MYKIKQAAARAGVSVPVLRAWERRYGIVKPDRTPAGYRVFGDDDITRIRTMRRLVDQGWSPSSAASAILAGAVDEQNDGGPPALQGAGSGTHPAQAGSGSAEADAETAVIVQRFVDGARKLDAGAISEVLDDVLARGSFERVVIEFLFPALHALGDAWAAGTVGVAGEHLASAAVMRRLGQAFDAAGPATTDRVGRILIGLPPGGRHEIGALAFAVAARRAGLPVEYLGPDLPLDDWLAAAEGAAAAVIGVSIGRDRTAALDVVRGLRRADPGLLVALAGRHAPAPADHLRLPKGLREAVAALEAALVGSASEPDG